MDKEFVKINGKRRNSELIYVFNQKQLYCKNKNYKNNINYKCYIKNCNARMIIELPGNFLVRGKNFENHNHSTNQEELFEELQLLNRIKNDCESSANMLSDINAMSGVRKVFESCIVKLVFYFYYLWFYIKINRNIVTCVYVLICLVL